MKTLRERAYEHRPKGGHDSSWLAGYRAAVRDLRKKARKAEADEDAAMDAEFGASRRGDIV